LRLDARFLRRGVLCRNEWVTREGSWWQAADGG
jgi:hypothetical protein